MCQTGGGFFLDEPEFRVGMEVLVERVEGGIVLVDLLLERVLWQGLRLGEACLEKNAKREGDGCGKCTDQGDSSSGRKLVSSSEKLSSFCCRGWLFSPRRTL